MKRSRPEKSGDRRRYFIQGEGAMEDNFYKIGIILRCY